MEPRASQRISARCTGLLCKGGSYKVYKKKFICYIQKFCMLLQVSKKPHNFAVKIKTGISQKLNQYKEKTNTCWKIEKCCIYLQKILKIIFYAEIQNN